MNREINIEELKQIQLELLETLANYCDDHGLTYYLAYGTLLGAVRHKGYIPWDDDIDIMMPRGDYETLIAEFNKSIQRSSISVVSFEIDSEYYLSFAKLINTSTVIEETVNSDYSIGVYVDIFPLDKLGNDYGKAEKIVKRACLYNGILTIKNLTFRKGIAWYKNAILAAGRLIALPISRGKLIRMINKLGRNFDDNSQSIYLGDLTQVQPGSFCIVLESEWFSETGKAMFEGRGYNVPTGYDALLKKQYGDYMQLPPDSERVTHHEFRAWYK